MSRTLAWYDGVFVLGLLLIAGGLALWSAPLALVVSGILLVACSVLAALRARAVPSDSPSSPVTHGTPDRAAS